MPDLTDRTMVVTGANSGLGLATADALARAGARVVMACRSTVKAERAAEWIRGNTPRAQLQIMSLDLADLSSVRDFAARIVSDHEHLHGLCNNAGVMALPRRDTVDGFEAQFGTNHLGHFALTGLLLARLVSTPGARVVTVSSHMHRLGRLRFDDLHGRRRYRPWPAYGQSKLANLIFAFELDRRLRAANHGALSVAAHPGYASTNLQTAGPRMRGATWSERLYDVGNRLVAQSAPMGALPQLYALTAPDVTGGSYYGPARWLEMVGPPRRVRASARARSLDDAQRLWTVSESLTGVNFGVL